MSTYDILSAWSEDITEPVACPVGNLNPADNTFIFSTHWLAEPECRRFNPTGTLPSTPQAISLVTDSLPDSWDRGLARKLEEARARKEERKPRALHTGALIASVTDIYRQGALRFCRGETPSEFLSKSTLPAPVEDDLAELCSLSLAYEAGENLSAASLKKLAEPGLALGGSRPKVSFADETGALWLAKFPSIHDDRDKGAWEYLAMTLARRAGIRVADFKLIDTGGPGHTFAAKRFDRTPDGRRLHYLSTRALLGAKDNREPAGYLDILMLIERICGNTSADIEELWRRVAFKLFIHNGNDHLRNHGFLLSSSGWELSPAFDLNPSLTSRRLSLTWDEACAEFDIKAFASAAPVWGLSVARAREVIEEVKEAVSNWRITAKEIGIESGEIQRLSAAFAV